MLPKIFGTACIFENNFNMSLRDFHNVALPVLDKILPKSTFYSVDSPCTRT